MKKQICALLIVAVFNSSCATVVPKSAHGKFLAGAAIGGAAGAGGGAALSPDAENRSLNALIFGLTGAIAGGLTGLLLHKDSNDVPASTGDVRLKEEEFTKKGELYTVPLKPLPEGVKGRILLPIVEEVDEDESVDQDGSLHEGHKVWRIKEPAGFSPKQQKNLEKNDSQEKSAGGETHD
jgi:hypothetical protein